MSLLPSLPDGASLRDIFLKFPDAVRPLCELHEVLLRNPSPLTPGERELIAAYVSGLNACDYCHGVHSAAAEAFGIDPELLAGLVQDLDGAPLPARMRPLLAYVRKLTLTPARLSPEDARAVFDAGWDERGLYDAVMVCAMFNFMNRMVDGLGIQLQPGWAKNSGKALHDIGYAGLVDLLEQVREQS
jgi:uncharacterized peroxidase-related enzyme